MRLPTIMYSKDLQKDLYLNVGKPCLLKIKVKYTSEKDWIYHEFWICPGWKQTDAFQMAYRWMQADKDSLIHHVSQIEEAVFYELKTV